MAFIFSWKVVRNLLGQHALPGSICFNCLIRIAFQHDSTMYEVRNASKYSLNSALKLGYLQNIRIRTISVCAPARVARDTRCQCTETIFIWA